MSQFLSFLYFCVWLLMRLSWEGLIWGSFYCCNGPDTIHLRSDYDHRCEVLFAVLHETQQLQGFQCFFYHLTSVSVFCVTVLLFLLGFACLLSQGTISFGIGFFFVIIGWPVIGMAAETYGFIILFRFVRYYRETLY